MRRRLRPLLRFGRAPSLDCAAREPFVFVASDTHGANLSVSANELVADPIATAALAAEKSIDSPTRERAQVSRTEEASFVPH
jgi:hypothetical protein